MAQTLFLLVLSILALESAHSIRFLYRHFLSGITGKSLNAFYYACSHAKADYSRFMNVTASMAFRLVPDSLRTQPVFLCIDDTIVPKSGTKFEDVSILFDHAAQQGFFLPERTLFCQPDALRTGLESGQNFLAFSSARLSYVDKAEIKTRTGC